LDVTLTTIERINEIVSNRTKHKIGNWKTVAATEYHKANANRVLEIAKAQEREAATKKN
jgi:hypothetical protein